MKIDVSEREFHTILAALRYLELSRYDKVALPWAIENIASNLGLVEPLSKEETGVLCLRLNSESEG